MLFFTGVSATGNTLFVNVFGRPEMTTNQPLTETYRGCKKLLLTRYSQPISDRPEAPFEQTLRQVQKRPRSDPVPPRPYLPGHSGQRRGKGAAGPTGIDGRTPPRRCGRNRSPAFPSKGAWACPLGPPKRLPPRPRRSGWGVRLPSGYRPRSPRPPGGPKPTHRGPGNQPWRRG